MSIIPTWPGVYIQELTSSVRTITGVATSITAFIGRTLRGPVDAPRMIHSFGDFERVYGGLWKKSYMSYAVYQYFLNGGRDCIIVRVNNGAGTANFSLANSTLALQAANPGTWGESLSIVIDHNVDPDKLSKDPTIFNLTVTDTSTGTIEKYLNLSADPNGKRFITKVLAEESQLVAVSGNVPNAQPTSGIFTCSQMVGNQVVDLDGSPITDMDVMGNVGNKTGIYALDNADLFNLLCIPPYDDSADPVPAGAYATALDYCKKRRAMLIIDPPIGWVNKDAPQAPGTGVDGFTRDANAAIFFPRINAPDPLDENRTREFVPCGAVAGVIAKTDGTRGIWKSPAGIETNLMGVTDLTVRLTDNENGELNPLGVNCLRIMPVIGAVVWGSRTLRGADRLADQWKYLSVRRMALFLEESLYRGTQWVVFEPNDEPLWSQIRLNIGAFMQTLFLQGAFQGNTPKDAYFVKCDSETTTQTDINSGIVNIVVGFAPLKPAEFVILKIQQIAGQGAP